MGKGWDEGGEQGTETKEVVEREERVEEGKGGRGEKQRKNQRDGVGKHAPEFWERLGEMGWQERWDGRRE